jgi:hypothetical protein
MICSTMNARTAPPTHAADADAPEAWERALLDRQLESVDRLAEMGMAMASAIQQRATDPAAADAAVQHGAMDFARVSRAVRLTLALQSKLVRDFKTPAKAAAADKDAVKDIAPGSLAALYLRPVWEDPSEDLGPSQKDRLRDAVRRAAEEAGLDAETAERLQTEALEMLERDDIAGMLNRSFAEIVALICEELGLHHLPREAAGGGPSGERSEHPMVEGAGGYDRRFDRVTERRPAWSG